MSKLLILAIVLVVVSFIIAAYSLLKLGGTLPADPAIAGRNNRNAKLSILAFSLSVVFLFYIYFF